MQVGLEVLFQDGGNAPSSLVHVLPGRVVCFEASLDKSHHDPHDIMTVCGKSLLAHRHANETHALKGFAPQLALLGSLGIGNNLLQHRHHKFVIRLKKLFCSLPNDCNASQTLLLHGPGLCLLKPAEELVHDVIHERFQRFVIELFTHAAEGTGRVACNSDICVVQAYDDRLQQVLMVSLLHIRLVVVGHLAHSLVCGVANPRMWVAHVWDQEVHALINPGCTLLRVFVDVLHDLRDSHDNRSDRLPVASGSRQSSSNHLEENCHEDFFERLFLRAMLRQSVQVFLTDLDGIAIVVIIFLGIFQRCPGINVLIHLEHPLDVQGD
mmetsp:Transcript_15966/g.28372  ORF Transcript_15966/g.28372 Transcript_15966/m.28372 type:complete len:324 (+) Transcript_15966:1610-2581(+)